MLSWFHSLTGKFMLITTSVLLVIMTVLYLISWDSIEKDAEDMLLERGHSLATSLAGSLRAVTENDIKNGVTLADGTKLSGSELRAKLFDDELKVVPESEQSAKKRSEDGEYAKQTVKLFNGKEIPLAQYELKYASAYDAYTDERWQGVIDSFLTDKLVTFALPIAFSDKEQYAGYIATHNSVYSPTGDASKDMWGDTGVLSQSYRANRVFNDSTGYNAAAYKNTEDVLVQKYPRVIDGKVVELWDIAYPLVIDGEHWGGVRVALSKADADALISQQRLSLLIQFAVLLLLVLAVIFWLSHFTVRRKLNRIVHATRNLNSGEADLTYRIDVKGKDEIAELAQEVNVFVGHLQDMVGSVSRKAAQVSESSREMAGGAERTVDVAGHIAATIREVARGAEQQAVSAGDSAKATEEMAAGIQRIAESSMHVSDAAHGMVNEAESGSGAAQTALRRMDELGASVQAIGDTIDKLNGMSEEIGAIATVISGIASQTNLLALNAAIEAARAGEQGRGFAVVAGEIRKLAVQSDASASHIAELIAEVQATTAKAAASMGEGNEAVERSSRIAGELSERFVHLLEAARGISSQIEEISAASQQMSAGTEEVTASIETMAGIAGDASSNSARVAEAANEQLTAMSELNGVIHSLRNLAVELESTVKRFKVE